MNVYRLTNNPDIFDSSNTTGDVTVYGDNGDDSISTGSGNDIIYGENGDDVINAGAGNDIIDGGRGDDRITTGAGADTVILSSNGGNDTVTDFRGMETGPAKTITFDDLGVSSGGAAIPDGYNGFHWGNTYFLTGSAYSLNPSGYNNVGSGTNVAFDAYAAGGDIKTAGTNFSLKSADIAAAWDDGLQVEVQGFNHGVKVADQIVTLDINKHHVTFDPSFTNLDEVTFKGVPGTGTHDPHVYGYGDHVALDNLEVAFQQQSQDKLQVGSSDVASGLLASARDVAGGASLDYQGYHVVLLGQSASNIKADWITVG